jgi:hypothetical protein
MSDAPATRDELALLEALADSRLGMRAEQLDPALRERLEELTAGDPTRARVLAEEAARARAIDWAGRQLTQEQLLGGFARHCAEELDDVVVEESTPTLLVARWKAEVSRLELRAGTVAVERLVSDIPTMVIADLGDDPEPLVTRFLDAPELRSRVVVFDPVRLEKVGAVRSSVFVYLEWHLRDAYGVKVLPAPSFTRGLVDRGVISLGMG